MFGGLDKLSQDNSSRVIHSLSWKVNFKLFNPEMGQN